MHGGIKARETSLARDWQGKVLYNLFLYRKGRMPGTAPEIDVTIDCPTSSMNARVPASSAPGVRPPTGPAPRQRLRIWAAPAAPPGILPDPVP